MAQGDQNDMLSRLQAQEPSSWFPTVAPIRDGLLSAFASMFAWCWSMLEYVILQTRISTATDYSLDIIALDYFGPTGLVRRSGELDTAYRTRILNNLLLPRGTVAAVSNAVELLTGNVPTIFEPANPGDTGGYGHRGGNNVTGLGYGVAGAYGSLALPFQSFVTVYRGPQGGIANVAGYGHVGGVTGMPGGYGVGAIEYGSLTMVQGLVQDSDIYATVAATIPAGSIAWTRITNPS